MHDPMVHARLILLERRDESRDLDVLFVDSRELEVSCFRLNTKRPILEAVKDLRQTQ